MATVIGNGQIKKNDGTIITPQQGAWYDGQQFWGGTLSQAGQINSQSNQQGAGQQVSNEVIAQTNPNNVAYVQQQNGGGSMSGGGGTGISGIGGGGIGGLGTNPNVPNLPDLYKSLYASKGITSLEDEIANQEKGYNENISKINDNPWLSEANRVGRVQKLTTDYNNSTMGVRNDIATRKADIEMEIGIQTKQFDINSQASQQALSQFNTLLSMGALDNASSEDIAQITRSTGLSSAAIMSAVKAQQVKNTPTSVIQYDDGTNQGFAVVNTQTGDIINRQVVGASKPTKSGGGGGDENGYNKQDYKDMLINDASHPVSLKTLVKTYSSVLSIDDIYKIYVTYSPYGAPKETLAEIKAGKYKV